MAKLEQGILGPFRGKVGTTVGYLWRGKPVVRAYVREIHYPNTALQQAERDWFVAMVRFASEVRPALQVGFRQAAERAAMYETNWFVKRNKHHFRLLSDGAADESQNNRLEVDYQHLSLSSGAVAPVAARQAAVSADGVLSVEFDPNRQLRRSKAADAVHLAVYNASLGKALTAKTVERRAGRVSLLLPDGWREAELHCYLFACDAQGEASATVHIEAGTSYTAECQPPTLPLNRHSELEPAGEAEQTGGCATAQELADKHDEHCPPGT